MKASTVRESLKSWSDIFPWVGELDWPETPEALAVLAAPAPDRDFSPHDLSGSAAPKVTRKRPKSP